MGRQRDDPGWPSLLAGLRRRLRVVDDDFLFLLIDRPHAPAAVLKVVIRSQVIGREDLGEYLVDSRGLGPFEDLHRRQHLLGVVLDGVALFGEGLLQGAVCGDRVVPLDCRPNLFVLRP